MSTETIVAPDAPTEIPASDTAVVPEVAEPETSEAAKPDESEKPEEDPRDKTVKNLTRRVDRVTAARYQAEARAQQAAAEAEQLRQELNQYRQGQEPAARQQDPVAIARQLNAIEKVNEKSNAIAKDGEAKFGKDIFSKALSVVIEEAGPLIVPIAPGASIGMPSALGEAILDSDDPAGVLNYLGNNPDAAAELHGLSATQVARRIAKIEIELSKAKEPKQSNAPKPITPVKSTTKDDGGLSDNLSPEEWAKRFRKMRREG
jgi:molecular chaperone GrpE (heat shock protein)